MSEDNTFFTAEHCLDIQHPWRNVSLVKIQNCFMKQCCWRTRLFLCSRSPSFYISSVALTLTSADTNQVASSLWVSMEPANRKQVRPDRPTLMPNVAVKEHEAVCWPCQATSAQASAWGAESCFLLRISVSASGAWVCVVSALPTWLEEAVRFARAGGHQSTPDRSAWKRGGLTHLCSKPHNVVLYEIQWASYSFTGSIQNHSMQTNLKG